MVSKHNLTSYFNFQTGIIRTTLGTAKLPGRGQEIRLADLWQQLHHHQLFHQLIMILYHQVTRATHIILTIHGIATMDGPMGDGQTQIKMDGQIPVKMGVGQSQIKMETLV